MATEKPRFSITMEDAMLDAVEHYRFENRINTRSNAVIQLVEKGLAELLNEAPAAPGVSPRAARVGQLYDIATERDRKLVDLTLEPYESKIGARVKRETKPQPKVRRRKDGFCELEVFEDQLPAAGYGTYFDAPRSHTEQYLAALLPDGVTFGVPIGGDSMEPKYKNHATAFVQSAPRVENGEVGLFSLNGEPYIKQLVVDEERREVRLHSINPAYDDIVVHEFDDLRTFGRVLGSYPE